MKNFDKFSRILKGYSNNRTNCSKNFKTSFNQTNSNTKIQKDLCFLNSEDCVSKSKNKENSLLMLKYLKQKGRDLIPFIINNIHQRKKQGYFAQISRANQAAYKNVFFSNQQNIQNKEIKDQTYLNTNSSNTIERNVSDKYKNSYKGIRTNSSDYLNDKDAGKTKNIFDQYNKTELA